MTGPSGRSKIVVYGAGGFAREVAWLIEECAAAGNPWTPVGFIDDAVERHGTLLNGLPIMSLDTVAARWPDCHAVVAVGAPATRRALAEKAAEVGLGSISVIHPRVERSRWVEIGSGTVICAGSILTTNIRIGVGVQINLDCTVGHDVILGDYSTLAPGVHVSGCVEIGPGAYIGTGASIINGTAQAPIVIGAGAVVGAGACVTRSVAPGSTVVGIPAKPRP